MTLTKQKLKQYALLFTLFGLLIVVSTNILAKAGILFSLGTYASIVIMYVSIIIFAKFAYNVGLKHVPKFLSIVYRLLISWFILQIIRGALIANNYWEYKLLFFNSLTFTLISLVFFLGNNLNITKYIFQKYLYAILPIAIVLLPLTHNVANQLFSRLAIPVTILLLFIPYIKKKWIIILTVIMIISILSEPGFRTGFIKIGVSLLLLIGLYTKLLNSKTVKSIIFLTMLALPIIMLTLGIIGSYNIFEKLSENEDLEYKIEVGDKLQKQNIDTRSFLYEEVLEDLISTDNLLFGKSPSQGYKSYFFYNNGGAMNGIRYSSEVNILNLMLYFGLVGCMLMVILVISVSYYGIFKSNNKLAITLGFLLLSRYLLFFIEEFTQFNFNFYFFWLVMGLVASKQFRSMNESQIKLWVRNIFNKSSKQSISLNK
ncbi:hypothetical protein [Confluentibacter sediminis]|uniref:hypothetical protein n=1 Tax=Confluentibacter sediminis TaxID=2219045 RepID=UPI000DAD9E9B|nr:hypothetical protein [Confluentibacter sediminis]